ncbi:hypothetical protein QTN94_19870, partial [Vibrio sp. M250220]|uniref:hypothetical protein n=1 Tax=Vibrio sp. M250220 TaxID=3020894 RepID=UPI002F3E3F53
VDHYPNGHLMQQEPLNPGNKKITLVHETTEPGEVESLGEFFELFSAGGHKDFLDMLICSSQTGHFIKRHFAVQS